jgi:hypothetical protein
LVEGARYSEYEEWCQAARKEESAKTTKETRKGVKKCKTCCESDQQNY